MRHKVYGAIIKAITAGKLIEPFTSQDFQKNCPGLGDGTYNAFLPKHTKGNPGGNSELFERVGPEKFRCLRPFKYGF
jgi:hypothetical protein